MARVKRAVNSRKNHKKVLKLAKGYYGGKSKLFKTANESVIRALRNAYVGRRLKKRDYRRLWIARINAATRIIIFKIHERNEISWNRHEQKNVI